MNITQIAILSAGLVSTLASSVSAQTPSTLPAEAAPISAPAPVIGPTTTIQGPSMVPVRNVRFSDDTGPKSPNTAIGRALLGSLVGAGLFAVGVGSETVEGAGLGIVALVVAPSAGRWYAGEFGTGPMLVRGLGAASLVTGVAAAFGASYNDCRDCDNSKDKEQASLLITAGGIALLGGTIYDIATAGDAARRYNRAHRESGLQSLQISPLLKRNQNSGDVAGLSLSGAF
jgi:hypothetical protein